MHEGNATHGDREPRMVTANPRNNRMLRHPASTKHACGVPSMYGEYQACMGSTKHAWAFGVLGQ